MRSVRKPIKLALICACCLLLPLALMLFVCSRRTMLERSERTYIAPGWEVVQHRFYWLTDSSVLYTDLAGDVKILDVSTGTAMKVQKLTDITFGLLIWHGRIELSPDRKLILYIDDGNTAALVCTTAGSVVARWHLKYSYPDWIFGHAAWNSDSRHWTCIYFRYPDDVSHALIYDIQNPAADNTHLVHISSAFGEQFSINQFGVHSLSVPSPTKGTSVITIFTGKSISDDNPVVSLLPVNQFYDAPGQDDLKGEFSPGGEFILWRLESYEHRLRFHTSWPFVSRDTFDSGENDWLSDQHGHGLKYIGHLPTFDNSKLIQSKLEWLPGDKGFSYCCNGRLYVYRFE